MDDKEIIKALKICGTYKGKCTDCPAFVKVDRSNCKQVLLGAIEIINRLQAERDAWKETAETSEKAYEEWHRVAELNAMKIIELQAENEVLKARIGVYETCNARKDEAIRGLEAEIERLKGHQKDGFFNLLGNCLVFSKTLKDYNDMRKGLKAEAVKDFAARLKEELRIYGIKDKFNKSVFLNVVDKAKKELVGEDNGKEKE